MRRHRTWAVAAALLALAVPAAAPAHEGDPNFLSTIRQAPSIEGLSVDVLNRDDRLVLVNRTGRDVLVEGYLGEPYAKIAADGTVAVNENSEATYTNEERFGAQVPEGVDPKGPPKWRTIDKTGRFEWHDHRIHWMSGGEPPQVKDRGVRTKIFDWTVPLKVGTQSATITGVLEWTPRDDGGGAPVGAIVALVVLVVGGAATVLVVRRRRAGSGGDGDGGAPAAGSGEAW